ncbi:DUF1929-domain-containing protein [Artomyces pyxidatus]|uniref:DUF1929-domain-containing protein n=1 Tax=Artomyces pyxidatus TaxID=48021 RepID=A0ACB8SP94_9AGAM|nr:DUF1929-domain-containing protein [Artomyces pyxidatus]
MRDTAPRSAWTRTYLFSVFLHAAVATASFKLKYTAPPPGQPIEDGPAGAFKIVGNSLVSAQQLFLGTEDRVYIIDKTENNPAKIGGHPAWGAEYSIEMNQGRPMDIVTNAFCAGGNVMGNGTWVNVGGNVEVTYGGVETEKDDGRSPYHDPDGIRSIRLLDPCDDDTCDWLIAANTSTKRWYPTVETLDDGTVIILGGCRSAVFVNDVGANNPNYEFYPPRNNGTPVFSDLLNNTLPANLYPFTFLLPSGKLLLQANWKTSILDYKTGTEKRIDDMLDAVRTYPATAGVAMLPLTPANNWTATIMFCGGQDIPPDNWTTNWDIAQHPASTSCVQITPDVSGSYTRVDPLPEGRSMGNMILLPTGQVLMLNGAATGVAGIGNDTWAVGESYADHPRLQPALYTPGAPAGSQWTTDEMAPSTIPRMYHSTATLLPDGSVFVAGSNPNFDYNVADNVTYKTEYRIEKFFPPYFNQRRPAPRGLPTSLTYGGSYFDISLAPEDLLGDLHNVGSAKVVVLRTGFSTHGQNMGQRMVQLETAFAIGTDGSATLHCSQLPPNPAVIAPGPALLFVVVAGVPSVGVQVMLGSGEIGVQQVAEAEGLPGPDFGNASANALVAGGETSGARGGLRRAVGWLVGAVGAVVGIVFV